MEKEIVICAAVRVTSGAIYRGHRHVHALQAARDAGEVYEYGDGGTQGFITSKNRYVDRREGYALQVEAGIASKDTKNPYMGSELYSEDLY